MVVRMCGRTDAAEHRVILSGWQGGLHYSVRRSWDWSKLLMFVLVWRDAGGLNEEQRVTPAAGEG